MTAAIDAATPDGGTIGGEGVSTSPPRVYGGPTSPESLTLLVSGLVLAVALVSLGPTLVDTITGSTEAPSDPDVATDHLPRQRAT